MESKKKNNVEIYVEAHHLLKEPFASKVMRNKTK